MQWYCIAVVIAELGGNKDERFVEEAWKVLDPILEGWDRVYESKREEPAWEHVNSAIQRAKGKRVALEAGNSGGKRQQVRMAEERTQHSMPVPTEMVLASTGASAAQWTGMNGIWQTTWTDVPDASTTVSAVPQAPSNAQPDLRQQYFSPGQTVTNDVPFHTGCAPLMLGMEMDFNCNDLSFNDGLDNIDFSAFEGVFGDGMWDFSPTSAELMVDGVDS